jgi:preprotein translocase subunit SecA
LTKDILPEDLARVEKQILLQVIDKNWREHLQQLDALKSVIGMRAYGQRDPLNEYKSEAFTLFDGLLTSLREDVTKSMMGALLNVQIRRQQQAQEQNQNQVQQQLEQAKAGLANMQAATPPRSPLDMVNQGAPAASETPNDLPADALKGVSRNSPCPCGSGLKVKQCHGKIS